MHREELRDRPGNLPTPFMIALAEVAAENIPTTALTNILGRVMNYLVGYKFSMLVL